jgi:hypothetical protein
LRNRSQAEELVLTLRSEEQVAELGYAVFSIEDIVLVGSVDRSRRNCGSQAHPYK